MAAQPTSLTATFDDSLSKVTLAIVFPTTVTNVSIVRVQADGIETVLAGGASFKLAVGVDNSTGTTYDYEMPFDVDSSYRATQVLPATGTPVVATSAAHTMLSQGRTWLKDPGQPANNMQLLYVEGLPQITRQARAGVFQVIDRRNPVVVTSARQGVSGDLTFTTMTQTEYDKVVKLVNRGVILLLVTAPAYGFGQIYVNVGDVTEDRIALGDASDWVRKWTLPLQQVDRPTSLTLTAGLEKWSDVKQSWVTWNDLYAANLTWDQLKALSAGATSPT